MKKAKRFLALFLVLCMMVCAMALPASAYTYHFAFPSTQATSLQHAGPEPRRTSTAYVAPDITTISTIYYLAPSESVSISATDLVYKTTGGRSNFVWRPNYGGEGGAYYLCGCPDWNMGAHTAYISYGSWNV